MDELKEAIQYADLKESAISSWSVGEQLEHILLTNEYILSQILNNYTKKTEKPARINWIGHLILWTGYILRGRGKAPGLTIPKKVSKEKIEKSREVVEKLLEEIEEKKSVLRKSNYAFPHPLFGMMSVKQWLRFNEVHTRHHVKIIRDILRAHRIPLSK